MLSACRIGPAVTGPVSTRRDGNGDVSERMWAYDGFTGPGDHPEADDLADDLTAGPTRHRSIRKALRRRWLALVHHRRARAPGRPWPVGGETSRVPGVSVGHARVQLRPERRQRKRDRPVAGAKPLGGRGHAAAAGAPGEPRQLHRVVHGRGRRRPGPAVHGHRAIERCGGGPGECSGCGVPPVPGRAPGEPAAARVRVRSTASSPTPRRAGAAGGHRDLSGAPLRWTRHRRCDGSKVLNVGAPIHRSLKKTLYRPRGRAARGPGAGHGLHHRRDDRVGPAPPAR